MGINDYLKAIQRRWPAVVVAGLLGLLIGYLVAPSAASHVSYSATATVLQASDVKDPAASTALLVTSDAVAERVSGTLDAHPAPQQLLPYITAVGDKTSSSIDITASGAQPQAAVTLANAFAQATVDEFLARHRDAAAASFKSLEGQLNDVENQLKQVAGATAAVTGQDHVQQTQAAALSSRYVTIYGLLQDAANHANNPTGLELVNPAVGAKSTAGAFALSSTTSTMAGLILGALLGAALALTLEHLDTRPRDQAAARRAYQLPVLVEIPKVRATNGATSR